MKFAISFPGLSRYPPRLDTWMANLRAPDYQRICREVEAIGYDAIESPEHLAIDASLVETMGGYWPSSLAAIAFFAGATDRILVNTRVLVLPFYHPVNLAKAIATLDVLSGGRVMLSVGLGHGKAEFRALNVPYEERGRIADEYLQAMRILWTEDRPSFHGRFVSFDQIAFEPKPVQKPQPPIWIGGNSTASLRRAARFGVGWRPWRVGLEELPSSLAALERMAEHQARDAPLELHIPAAMKRIGEDHRPLHGSKDGRAPELAASELLDRISELANLGVTWTELPAPRAGSLEEFLDRLRGQAEAVIAPIKKGEGLTSERPATIGVTPSEEG